MMAKGKAPKTIHKVHGLISAAMNTAEMLGYIRGRGVWRIGRQDLGDHIAEAYRRTAERIAVGELKEDVET
jgi:hypothetical protein